MVRDFNALPESGPLKSSKPSTPNKSVGDRANLIFLAVAGVLAVGSIPIVIAEDMRRQGMNAAAMATQTTLYEEIGDIKKYAESSNNFLDTPAVRFKVTGEAGQPQRTLVRINEPTPDFLVDHKPFSLVHFERLVDENNRVREMSWVTRDGWSLSCTAQDDADSNENLLDCTLGGDYYLPPPTFIGEVMNDGYSVNRKIQRGVPSMGF